MIDDRVTGNGHHLLRSAKSLGWPDDGGEGALEFILRRTREIALIDAVEGHWHLHETMINDGREIYFCRSCHRPMFLIVDED
jgi:hypothetical protein